MCVSSDTMLVKIYKIVQNISKLNSTSLSKLKSDVIILNISGLNGRFLPSSQTSENHNYLQIWIIAGLQEFFFFTWMHFIAGKLWVQDPDKVHYKSSADIVMNCYK